MVNWVCPQLFSPSLASLRDYHGATYQKWSYFMNKALMYLIAINYIFNLKLVFLNNLFLRIMLINTSFFFWITFGFWHFDILQLHPQQGNRKYPRHPHSSVCHPYFKLTFRKNNILLDFPILSLLSWTTYPVRFMFLFFRSPACPCDHPVNAVLLLTNLM